MEKMLKVIGKMDNNKAIQRGLFIIMVATLMLFVSIIGYGAGVSHAIRDTASEEALTDVIYCRTDISDKEKELAVLSYNRLPESIRKEFEARNGKVYLVDKIENAQVSDAAGRTKINPVTGDATIEVKKDYVLTTFLHEFGHFYYKTSDIPEGFDELYKKEGKEYIETTYQLKEGVEYQYSSEEEFFCEVFRDAILCGGESESLGGFESFQYMKALLDKEFNI